MGGGGRGPGAARACLPAGRWQQPRARAGGARARARARAPCKGRPSATAPSVWIPIIFSQCKPEPSFLVCSHLDNNLSPSSWLSGGGGSVIRGLPVVCTNSTIRLMLLHFRFLHSSMIISASSYREGKIYVLLYD